MRIVYIANDGREFNDEYECEAYERKQANQNLFPNCRFYYTSRKQMTHAEFFEDPEACDYMDIPTNEEAIAMNKFLRDEAGIETPWRWGTLPKEGRYYWHNDQWKDFNADYARLAGIKEMFDKEG